MYRFSRSIYREIAPAVIEDERDPAGCRNKQLVLDACEEVIRRLTHDRRYFARPARKLFTEVRTHFAIGDQARVWTVIDRNIGLALEFLERLPEGAGLDGVPRECRAHTRKGTPCQRRFQGAATAHLTSTWRSASIGPRCRSRCSTRWVVSARAGGARCASAGGSARPPEACAWGLVTAVTAMGQEGPGRLLDRPGPYSDHPKTPAHACSRIVT